MNFSETPAFVTSAATVTNADDAAHKEIMALSPDEITQDQSDSESGRVAVDKREQVKTVAAKEVNDFFVREMRIRERSFAKYGLRLLSSGESVKYGSALLPTLVEGKELLGIGVLPIETTVDVLAALHESQKFFSKTKSAARKEKKEQVTTFRSVVKDVPGEYIAFLGGDGLVKDHGILCLLKPIVLRVLFVEAPLDYSADSWSSLERAVMGGYNASSGDGKDAGATEQELAIVGGE